ncbi:sigma-70 family RNA polymerase sigma factor [bacterium]|nr:sigma-70 family RNA polymerase sigma factor [bacterium]
MSEASSNGHKSPAAGRFATTRWSLIVAAGTPGLPESQAALTELCSAYWSPLYSYVRKRGHSVDDSRDLTQEFFARLLEKTTVAAADPQRGRFRTFLLTSMQNFLANEHDRETALKRGGGTTLFPMDFDSAERGIAIEPADSAPSPEAAFEREWALQILQQALAELKIEYVESGRRELFDALSPALTDASESPRYSSIADARGMSRDAVRMAASRLRKRYRELIRSAIRSTVASDDEVESELADLFRALS